MRNMRNLPTLVLALTLLTGCAGDEVYEERATTTASPVSAVKALDCRPVVTPRAKRMPKNSTRTTSAKTIEGLEQHD